MTGVMISSIFMFLSGWLVCLVRCMSSCSSLNALRGGKKPIPSYLELGRPEANFFCSAAWICVCFLCIHEVLALRASCVPEKVSVSQKDVHQK